MCKMTDRIGSLAQNTPTPRIQGSASVMQAMEEMDLCEANIIAIECEGDFVGIFRRDDLHGRVIRQNLNPMTTTLYEVMTIDPPAIDGYRSVKEVYEHMIRNKLEYIAVVTSRALHGIVSLRGLSTDVIKAYEDVEAENRMILNYMQCGESYGMSRYRI